MAERGELLDMNVSSVKFLKLREKQMYVYYNQGE
jgi:hypothetical protein